MKTLLIMLLLSLSGCKLNAEKEKKNTNSKSNSQNQREKVAVDFVNGYVTYLNSGNADKEIQEWVSEQPNVTGKFKSALKKLIVEAAEENPELGLGFDPILDAQDYPDKGFELVQSETTSSFVMVKAVDWGDDWKIKIKMKQDNNFWTVDGIGVINMP